MSAPYRVEVDTEECPQCGRGPTFLIVGPDNVAMGTTFSERADADDVADDLNFAFAAGVASVLQRIEEEHREPDAAVRRGQRSRR